MLCGATKLAFGVVVDRALNGFDQDQAARHLGVRGETLELNMDTQIDAINDEDLDFVSGGDYHSSTQEIKCPIGSLMVYDSGCCVPTTVEYKPPPRS